MVTTNYCFYRNRALLSFVREYINIVQDLVTMREMFDIWYKAD